LYASRVGTGLTYSWLAILTFKCPSHEAHASGCPLILAGYHADLMAIFKITFNHLSERIFEDMKSVI
jgi:hypothetical protein